MDKWKPGNRAEERKKHNNPWREPVYKPLTTSYMETHDAAAADAIDFAKADLQAPLMLERINNCVAEPYNMPPIRSDDVANVLRAYRASREALAYFKDIATENRAGEDRERMRAEAAERASDAMREFVKKLLVQIQDGKIESDLQAEGLKFVGWKRFPDRSAKP